MIPLSRPILLLAGVCAAVGTVIRGVMLVPSAQHPARVIIALVLYSVCVLVSAQSRAAVLPAVLGGMNAGVSLAIALLCAGENSRPLAAGDMDWRLRAAGGLLVLTMVRRQVVLAWIGTALVVAQTAVWSGVGSLVGGGAVSMALCVAAAYVAVRSFSRALRDIRQFGRAEQEAVEWQAAQDAHHFERQVRLRQTSRVALPMLRHIVDVQCDLDEAAKQECRVLEQTIRDEIRGRRLLNDAVRDQVIAHRRRGAFVQMLDDGGLDDVDPALMEPVLDRVAEAISGIHSDRIIIRTAPKGSDKAVTVVGITEDPTSAALGLGDDDDEVDIWLELPRPVGAAV